MNNQPILFIDSGIGGFSYCMDFLKKNPDETVYYLADKKNYPYGPKTKEEITSILIKLIETILNFIKPKLIVLACNTATVAALQALRHNFTDIPFVGTVPAVKPAAEAISGNKGKVGVLGTKRTIEEIKNLHLTEKCCEITGIAAPELVDFIELNYNDSKENEKIAFVKKYIDLFRNEKADTLVLGCTHFLFLQEEFRREAAPDLSVFDSLEGISRRIEFLLNENGGKLRAEEKKQNKLLLTGKENINPYWEKQAKSTGFKIEMLAAEGY